MKWKQHIWTSNYSPMLFHICTAHLMLHSVHVWLSQINICQVSKPIYSDDDDIISEERSFHRHAADEALTLQHQFVNKMKKTHHYYQPMLTIICVRKDVRVRKLLMLLSRYVGGNQYAQRLNHTTVRLGLDTTRERDIHTDKVIRA